MQFVAITTESSLVKRVRTVSVSVLSPEKSVQVNWYMPAEFAVKIVPPTEFVRHPLTLLVGSFSYTIKVISSQPESSHSTENAP